MAIRKTVTCDCCGIECGRWFEISACPAAKEPWQNVSDMLPGNGLFIWQRQLCKECFTRLLIDIPKEKT